MAKQLNVNLAFTADTSQAKKQLADLQESLKKLTQSMSSGNSLGFTDEIAKASSQIAQLQIALKSATTSSGKLDLSQFHQELQKANLDATKLSNSFAAFGEKGKAAFASLTQSVMTAEIPLKKTSSLLKEFTTTIKNTARWQISSDILHGLESGLRDAYDYAQDLNKSLNDIRVVTGQSSEQMAEFAERANESAKALSASTLAYTDAALIFYQEGLNDTEVKERTDTTIKMSNVTGDSVDDVSSYMTAIWENYADGSKNLEYYADVITRLGADTAASSAEIAEGLESFASIGETIGLSYEYATSALTTLVAKTRASASEVGNGLRTIFSRLQSLSLGETLEDGTDLTKYSKALATVGVDVKDASGELRRVDDILKDIGERWDSLSRAQQTALANTVGGVRQYTKFISLFDSWDFMEENLASAINSEGSLQEQADIYAESWEAARKRVTASLQEIYAKLIDDDAFITITDAIAGIIDLVSHLIDTFGGLKGVLSLVGNLLINTFGKNIANSLDNFVYNIKMNFSKGRQALLEERQAFNKELVEWSYDETPSGAAQGDVYTQQGEIQNSLISKAQELEAKNKSISEWEQKQLNLLMDINAQYGQAYIVSTAQVEKLREQRETLDEELSNWMSWHPDSIYAEVNGEAIIPTEVDSGGVDIWGEQIEKLQEIKTLLGEVDTLKSNYSVGNKTDKEKEALQAIIKNLENYRKEIKYAGDETEPLLNALDKLKESNFKDFDKNLGKVIEKFRELKTETDSSYDGIKKSMYGTSDVVKETKKKMDAVMTSAENLGRANARAAIDENSHANSIDNLKKQIEALNGASVTTSQKIVNIAGALSSLSMVANSVKGITDTLSDPDMSGWEKFISIMGTVGINIGVLMSTIKQLNGAFGIEFSILQALNTEKTASNALDIFSNTLKKTKLRDLKEHNVLLSSATAITMGLASAEQLEAIASALHLSVEELKNKSLKEQISLMGGLGVEKLTEIGLNETNAAAIVAEKLAQDAFNKSILASPALPIILAIAGAFAVVLAIIKAVTYAQNYFSEEIASANEAVNTLETSYEELAQKAEDFKEAVSDYQDAIDSLENLDTTTQEYKDTLKEVNEKAKELIETYKLFDQFKIVNGVITIDEEALSDAEGKMESDANDVETQLYGAKIAANQIEYAKDRWDLGEAAGTGPIIGPQFWNIGLKYDQIPNQTADLVNLAIEQNGGVEPTDIESLKTMVKETFDGLSSEQKAQYGQAGSNYFNNIFEEEDFDLIMSSAKRKKENDEENAYYTKEIISNQVEEKYGKEIEERSKNEDGDVDESRATLITAATTGYLASQESAEGFQEELENRIAGSSSDKNLSNKDFSEKYSKYYNIDTDEDLAREYAKTVLKEDVSQLTYTGGTGKGTLTRADRTTVIDEMSDEEMKRALARAAIIKDVTAEYGKDLNLDSFNNNLDTVIANLDKKKEETGIDYSAALLNSMANGSKTFDFSGILSGINPLENEELQGLISPNGNEESMANIAEYLGISVEDLKNLGFDSADEFVDGFKEQLNNYDPSSFFEELSSKISTSSDAISTLLKGDELSEDQLTSLQGLEDEYDELSAIQDKNSEEYLDKLIEIREELEKEQTAMKELEASNTAGEALVILEDGLAEDEIDDLQNSLEELCDQEYEVLVSIKTDAQDDFDTAVSTIEDMEEAVGLIGENFVVAAEDIEELNDAFPGITDGMDLIGDGSAQLKEEVVQNATEAAEQAAEQQVKETITALEAQKAEVDARKEAAGTILRVLDEQLAGSKSISENEELLSNALTTLQTTNSDDYSLLAQTNQLDMAATAKDASVSMATNTLVAYEQMRKAAVTYAETAHEGLLYASSKTRTKNSDVITQEEKIVLNKNKFENAPTETKDSSEEYTAQQIEEWEGYDKEQLESEIKEYQSLVASYSVLSNNLQGKIDELRARGDNLKNIFKNKGSGSSSSGSSGSSKEPEQKEHEEYLDDEAEAYKDINESIEKVESELNELDKTQDHLAGKELINSLKQENKLLEQQKTNYAKLNKEIQARNDLLKSKLSEYGNVDKDSYENIFNNILKTYNKAVDNYNSIVDGYNSMTAEEQESYKEALETAKDQLDAEKDKYDKMMDYLDEYYDNKEELRSNDEKQQELLYQQIENNLEAYEVEIELKLDTTEAERSLAEFLKNMQVDIKNSYKTSSEWGAELGLNESNSALAENDINTHLTELAKYQKMLKDEDWGKESSLFASESELLQAINETQSSLIEDAGNLLDTYEDAYSDLQDMFDEAIEQFEDTVTGVLDRIDDTIDHYQKVNELLYGDSMTGLENNDAVYESQMKSQLARQSALKELIASLNEEMVEALAKGIDPDDSYITSIKEQINEADSELQSSVESYLETLQSVFENTLSIIRKETDEAIFGDSFSDVQQEWDDRKAMAEGYYDEVEKIYQLESLENKWRSAINSTSSLKAQKQLKTIMDKQVKTLEEKTALSEKDVALAEKEIALYQAQIALEEAQNSKNAMKLIRDESGNWSYQYIADEDEVEEKQQDYLDKLNEYRTAAIDATEEVQEKYLNAYNDLMDRWNEIQENAKNGSISEEERLEAIAELQETYLGKNGILTKIFEEANYFKIKGNEATFLELWGLYKEDEKNYEKMTDAEKDAIDGLKEYGITSSDQLQKIFSEGSYEDILKLADAVNKDASVAWSSTLSEALNSSNLEKIIEIFNNLKTKGTEMIQEYQEGIKEGEDASGDSFTKIGEHLTETNSQIEQVKETANGFFDQFSEGLSAAIDQVISLKDKWDALSESIKNSVKDIGDIASKLAGSNISTTVGILGNVGTVNISSSTKSKSGENSNGKSSITTISSNDIKSFDTGGYTGDWGGGQGRLAVLHAKELVLNSKDTSNLLSAVSAMRSLTNFEDISNSITASVASLVKKMLGFETNSLKGFFNRSKDTEAVNNVFNINAEFPNANNADEIREAILSLPNLASQYLSRNRL